MICTHLPSHILCAVPCCVCRCLLHVSVTSQVPHLLCSVKLFVCDVCVICHVYIISAARYYGLRLVYNCVLVCMLLCPLVIRRHATCMAQRLCCTRRSSFQTPCSTSFLSLPLRILPRLYLRLLRSAVHASPVSSHHGFIRLLR